MGRPAPPRMARNIAPKMMARTEASEAPVEPQDWEDALLLAELLGVGAAIPGIAGEVAAVGHVLHANKHVERLSADREGAIHADVDAAVVGRSLGVHACQVVYAAPLFRGHGLVVGRERPARQKGEPG